MYLFINLYIRWNYHHTQFTDNLCIDQLCVSIPLIYVIIFTYAYKLRIFTTGYTGRDSSHIYVVKLWCSRRSEFTQAVQLIPPTLCVFLFSLIFSVSKILEFQWFAISLISIYLRFKIKSLIKYKRGTSTYMVQLKVFQTCITF